MTGTKTAATVPYIRHPPFKGKHLLRGVRQVKTDSFVPSQSVTEDMFDYMFTQINSASVLKTRVDRHTFQENRSGFVRSGGFQSGPGMPKI